MTWLGFFLSVKVGDYSTSGFGDEPDAGNFSHWRNLIAMASWNIPFGMHYKKKVQIKFSGIDGPLTDTRANPIGSKHLRSAGRDPAYLTLLARRPTCGGSKVVAPYCRFTGLGSAMMVARGTASVCGGLASPDRSVSGRICWPLFWKTELLA